jgi:hypothetical protein
MPPTSEHFPLIGFFYVVCIIVILFSTGMSVLTININNNGQRGNQVPKMIKKIFFNYVARILLIKIDSVKSRRDLNNRWLNESSNTASSDHIKKFINNFNSNRKTSDEQNLVPKLQCKRKFISNVKVNNGNATSIQNMRMKNRSRAYSLKRSANSNKDDHENDILKSINHNFNSNNLNQSDLEIIIKNYFQDLIVKIKNSIDKNQTRLFEKEIRTVIQNEWTDLAIVLDRLFFIFLFSITILTWIFLGL